MTTSATLESQAHCRVILKSADGDQLVVHVPESDYQLHLRAADDAGLLAGSVEKRVHGVIRGRALRIHTAAGGGQFIEPVTGEPRIVTGRLMAVDQSAQTLLVRAAVPMLIEAEENRDLNGFAPGELVTFHVESGATFTPVAE